MTKKIAFTGHRPPKTGLVYGLYNNKEIELFIRKKLDEELKTLGYLKVITGGAVGIDQIAALAVYNLKNYARVWTKDMPKDWYTLISEIAEPFDKFYEKWPTSGQEEYLYLVKFADKLTQVCEPGYANWKYQKRDEYMVDNADELWAWWDGSSGGTKNTVDYAKKVGKPVRNLYEEYNARN